MVHDNDRLEDLYHSSYEEDLELMEMLEGENREREELYELALQEATEEGQ
jgi:hypothetical protein